MSRTFETLPLLVSKPCICVNGATAVTCGFCLTLAARLCQSLIASPDSMVAWGTMPSTRVRIS
ncbi:hypothetical protein D3C81_1993220 [compost metagenome]